MKPSAARPAVIAAASLGDRELDQPSHRRRQALGQSRDQAEIDHAEPSVGQHQIVARVRVGVQQARPGGAGERKRTYDRPTRLRTSVGDSAAVVSLRPSSQSLISTRGVASCTRGTTNSASPANASAACAWCWASGV